MDDAGKMDEHSEGKDVSKKTSSRQPAPKPVSSSKRELTDLAVKFLTNPRVMSHPLEAKKDFLRKKGLSESEIDHAIQLASNVQPAPTPTTTAVVPAMAPPLPPRPLTPLQPVQQSRTWRDYALTAVIVGGVGYALFHFVRTYVIPWLTAPRQQLEALQAVQSSVNQLHSSMADTISSLKESNTAIQALLSEQQQHVQLLTAQVTGLQTSLAQQNNGQPLRQLKEEVATLKGLLLNRHQFPASPSPIGRGGASIPEWQRNSNSSLPKASTPLKNLPISQHEDAVSMEAEVEGLKRTKEDAGNVVQQNGHSVGVDKSGPGSEEES